MHEGHGDGDQREAVCGSFVSHSGGVPTGRDGAKTARSPGITTERRRQLLSLAINVVDLMQSKTEAHERRFLFRLVDSQFND